MFGQRFQFAELAGLLGAQPPCQLHEEFRHEPAFGVAGEIVAQLPPLLFQHGPHLLQARHFGIARVLDGEVGRDVDAVEHVANIVQDASRHFGHARLARDGQEAAVHRLLNAKALPDQGRLKLHQIPHPDDAQVLVFGPEQDDILVERLALASQGRFEGLAHRHALAQQQGILHHVRPNQFLAIDGESVAVAHEKAQMSARAQPRHPARLQHGAIVLLMGFKLFIDLGQRSARFGLLPMFHQTEQVGLLNAGCFLLVAGIFRLQ